MTDAGLLLVPDQSRDIRHESTHSSVPSHGGFRAQPAATVNGRNVSHNIDVINGEHAIPARAKPGKIRTLGNIVHQHHHIRRIMTKNFGSRGSFKLAAE